MLSEDSKCLILTHDNPDPDSIASAYALRHILKTEKRILSQIAFGGLVGRAENRAMLEYLNIKFLQIDEINWDDYQYIALVDTQPNTGNNSLPHGKNAHIVIDHHPLRKATKSCIYYDVRDRIGATATILAEYLARRNITISVQLATSLFYGIKSETQDLGRESSKKDLKMYTYLFPMTNKKRLSTIVNSRLAPFYFRELSKMLSNVYLRGDVITSDLGRVEHSDIISEMADFMLRLENMSWSICIGQYKNTIYISVRTVDEKIDSGRIMSRLLRKIGSGGGHEMSAGGKISIIAEEENKISKIKTTFLKGFFKNINREYANPIKLLEG